MNGPLLSKGGQVYYGELEKNQTSLCPAQHGDFNETCKIRQVDPYTV